LVFDCEFETQRWVVHEEVYTCTPEIYDDPLIPYEIYIKGNHEPDKKLLSDVRALAIYNQHELREIPKGLGIFFTYLLILKIYNSRIHTISAKDLQQFPRLTILWIEFTLIQTLDGNLFSYTPNIMWIQFRDNFIRHVGENLLTGFSYLGATVYFDEFCIKYSAETPEQIKELNRMLSEKCPIDRSNETMGRTEIDEL
jgi:hypothetical protein